MLLIIFLRASDNFTSLSLHRSLSLQWLNLSLQWLQIMGMVIYELYVQAVVHAGTYKYNALIFCCFSVYVLVRGVLHELLVSPAESCRNAFVL